MSELERLRALVSETDRAILDAVNRRLELVAQIKRHKDAHGIDFLDPEREAALRRALGDANRGPLTEQGLDELVAEILALTKRELER